jgi:hypothetical protein
MSAQTLLPLWSLIVQALKGFVLPDGAEFFEDLTRDNRNNSVDAEYERRQLNVSARGPAMEYWQPLIASYLKRWLQCFTLVLCMWTY